MGRRSIIDGALSVITNIDVIGGHLGQQRAGVYHHTQTQTKARRPCSVSAALTFIAHGDAIVHDEADAGHKDPEDGQKHPVLSYSSECVLPNVTQHFEDSPVPLSAIWKKFLTAEAFLSLPLLLQLPKASCLALGEISQLLRIFSVYLMANIGKY